MDYTAVGQTEQATAEVITGDMSHTDTCKCCGRLAMKDGSGGSCAGPRRSADASHGFGADVVFCPCRRRLTAVSTGASHGSRYNDREVSGAQM